MNRTAIGFPIIPEYLKDQLEGKEYKPKGAARIVDLGVKTAWEIPGLLLDMINRDRGKGLKGGLSPRLSHVRKQDKAIRELGPQGIGGTPQTRQHDYFDGGDIKPIPIDAENRKEVVNKLYGKKPPGVTQEEFNAWSRERTRRELEANINDPRYDAKRAAFEKEVSTKRPGSTVFTRDKEGTPLGVMTRSQRRQWESANPDWQNWQPEGPEYKMPSVLKADGTLKNDQTIKKDVPKISRGDEIMNRVKANIPEKDWKELTKGTSLADKTGGNAKLASNLGTASTVLSALAQLTEKKEKPNMAGKEGGGGSIDQVAVAAGIDPEQFYSLV